MDHEVVIRIVGLNQDIVLILIENMRIPIWVPVEGVVNQDVTLVLAEIQRNLNAFAILA
jgi:hypothetical protein